MVKFISSMSLIASLLYLHTGILAYRLNKKSREYRLFLLWNISMFIWAFSYSFAYTAENNYVFTFWNKLSAVGWCTFPALTLYLVLTITNNKILNKFLSVTLIFIPAPMLFYIVVFLFGPSVRTSEFVKDVFYVWDFLYSFTYLLASILIMYFWGKKSDSYNEKKQARVIVITSIIPFILNLFSQTILPLMGISYFPNIGQIYSLIMLWGVNYAIVNYQFMGIPNSLITDELLDKMHDLTFLVGLDGKIIKASSHSYTLLEYGEEELVSTNILKLIKNESFKDLMDNCQLMTKAVKLKDINIWSKSGNIIPFDLSVTPLKDSKNQRILGILIVGQDIRLIRNLQSEIESHKLTWQRLTKSEELFRTMVEIAPFAIVLSNRADDTVIYANNKIEELFRVDKAEVIGKKAVDHYDNPEDRQKIVQDLYEGKSVKEREVKLRRKDNSIILCSVTIIPTIYSEQEVLLVCISDITEQKRNQENLRKSKEEIEKVNRELMDTNVLLHEKSVRDGLTNLYNHQYIVELLQAEIDKADKEGSSLCIMMLDIDFFKNINDTFGHQVGDQVLITISGLVRETIRNVGYAGRYGGEEFIIVTPQLSIDEAYELAEKIRFNIENLDFGVNNLKVTISIGLARMNEKNENQLINRADTLLYLAKKNGRNRIECDSLNA